MTLSLSHEGGFFTLRSVLGGACELQAVSWGGRLTVLALGLFILFFLTVYQSALTTQMVTAQEWGTVHNIDEGIVRGLRFCAQRVTAAQIARMQ